MNFVHYGWWLLDQYHFVMHLQEKTASLLYLYFTVKTRIYWRKSNFNLLWTWFIISDKFIIKHWNLWNEINFAVSMNLLSVCLLKCITTVKLPNITRIKAFTDIDLTWALMMCRNWDMSSGHSSRKWKWSNITSGLL